VNNQFVAGYTSFQVSGLMYRLQRLIDVISTAHLGGVLCLSRGAIG